MSARTRGTGKASGIRALIEILPGKDGLCHISEFSEEYVGKVTDVIKMGDEVDVKVIAIDEQDRVKLSRKAAMRELGLTDPKREPTSGDEGGGERPERPPRDDRPPRRDRGDRQYSDRGSDRGGDR